MKNKITIPPAALEAGARATLEELDAIAGLIGATRVDGELTPEEHEFFRRIARATCLAMIEAWPGMWRLHQTDEDFIPPRNDIILPLPQEATNG